MALVSCLLPVLVMLGFLLSSYAYYVERRFAKAKELGEVYRAYCDFSAFSCTRIFSSEYGSLTQFIGLPHVSNAALGMLFYLLELTVCRSPTLLFVVSAASCVASLGMLFILIFILHDICIVCCIIYVVNLFTCLCAWWWRRQTMTLAAGEKKMRKDK
ncbi:vitamin-K-epoxide reductase (warfarin-sensitive) [Trypanosoma rangeli]|uniref:vitamin-K-epoxide reductase (warfarin-sensitive) n=1 Tax=Trypanosoma rangeli TaxID=5698 RepID=A0A3R7K875_TRYRA|nr:vitamin-K-epoxide reductase (warfarin-sensitive) [Trypanosoma rangeli]RNF01589.1 vitamin-K-epoxide reductase (warfarin-sensitive) [Trypanosoma rangeli]|eukprot:RNF01589.1 vitamin-K-epoxide reductase (warfarin-sensitive) [Trypanosoma rangeli]